MPDGVVQRVVEEPDGGRTTYFVDGGHIYTLPETTIEGRVSGEFPHAETLDVRGNRNVPSAAAPRVSDSTAVSTGRPQASDRLTNRQATIASRGIESSTQAPSAIGVEPSQGRQLEGRTASTDLATRLMADTVSRGAATEIAIYRDRLRSYEDQQRGFAVDNVPSVGPASPPPTQRIRHQRREALTAQELSTPVRRSWVREGRERATIRTGITRRERGLGSSDPAAQPPASVEDWVSTNGMSVDELVVRGVIVITDTVASITPSSDEGARTALDAFEQIHSTNGWDAVINQSNESYRHEASDVLTELLERDLAWSEQFLGVELQLSDVLVPLDLITAGRARLLAGRLKAFVQTALDVLLTGLGQRASSHESAEVESGAEFSSDLQRQQSRRLRDAHRAEASYANRYDGDSQYDADIRAARNFYVSGVLAGRFPAGSRAATQSTNQFLERLILPVTGQDLRSHLRHELAPLTRQATARAVQVQRALGFVR